MSNSLTVSNVEFSIFMVQLNDILKIFNDICQNYEEKIISSKRKIKEMKNKFEALNK